MITFLLILAKILVTALGACISGFGLAAGFDLFKAVKQKWKDKKNHNYLDTMEQKICAGEAI